MQQISAQQLAEWLAAARRGERTVPLLLDVHEPWEHELCLLADSILMPMQTVPSRQQELDPDAALVVICHHGMRSMQVAMFLERNGFASLYNLAGGVDAWAHDVDPAMRRY